jgi:hypothetical protein
MPWKKSDAKKFTKKADTPKKASQWQAVTKSALSRGASEGSAIKQANAVVKKARGKSTVKRKGK